MNKKKDLKYIICTTCGKLKKREEFYEGYIKISIYKCKKCHRKYIKEYRQRPYVKELCKKRQHIKYSKDEKYRTKQKKGSHKQHKKGYFKKHHMEKKLGNPKVIKEMCIDFGIGEEIAKVIAIDGIELDKKLLNKVNNNK